MKRCFPLHDDPETHLADSIFSAAGMPPLEPMPSRPIPATRVTPHCQPADGHSDIREAFQHSALDSSRAFLCKPLCPSVPWQFLWPSGRLPMPYVLFARSGLHDGRKPGQADSRLLPKFGVKFLHFRHPPASPRPPAGATGRRSGGGAGCRGGWRGFGLGVCLPSFDQSSAQLPR